MFNRRYLRIKVMQSLYSKSMLEDSANSTLIKQLKKSVFNAWRLYILQLHTTARVAAQTENYHESQLNRHIKVMNEELISLRIMNNAFVNGTLPSDSFMSQVNEANIGLIISDEIIQQLFKQLLQKEYFTSYNNSEQKTAEEEYRVIHNIFKKLLLKSDLYISEIEEHFLGWTDDAQLVIKTVNKTIKTFFEKGEPYFTYVLPEIDWQETNDYIENLYTTVVNKEKELKEIIDPVLKNWDPNRLNLTDHILLKMAVSEFLYEPSVPVKVTINEFIEISKMYSTPKSKEFINGVLDKLLKQLSKKDLINKRGRGLIN